MPRRTLRRSAGASTAAALALAVVLTPVTVTAARADTNPTAQPTPSAPTGVDASDPDLELPEGATLAAPKVLDIVSVTDSSSTDAGQGEERQQTSNSQITYALQADILFGRDSAKLNPTAVARIRAIASDIKAKQVTSPIRVFGFTDNLGSYEHGKVLSKQRADAVYQVLAETLTDGNTFQVRGYSEDYPIADNSTEAGRKQNRRVEITFTPPSAS
jgi:outer membrane protein OmpA-like peptidoglycan-associated protein